MNESKLIEIHYFAWLNLGIVILSTYLKGSLVFTMVSDRLFIAYFYHKSD